MAEFERKDPRVGYMEKIKVLWLKWKQVILYLFFGGVTTLINIVTFYISYEWLGIHSLISNIIAWVAAVAGAYVTNKLFVFESVTDSFGALMKEMISFVACRVISLGADEGVMLIFNTILGYNAVIVKIMSNVIVVVMNYVFSKVFIFKGEK